MMTYVGQMPVDTSSPSVPVLGSLAVFSDPTGTVLKMFNGSDWVEISPDNSYSSIMKKLSCDQVKFGSSIFYTVEPQGYDWDELHDWITETFGHPRTGPGQSEAKWFVSEGSFYFHDVKNRDWVVLRWSS